MPANEINIATLAPTVLYIEVNSSTTQETTAIQEVANTREATSNQEVIKKRRGRPVLSIEQKAKNAAELLAKKAKII